MIEKIIESIPDSVHLHRIRDALRRGHAAVMVGAGFSRNAQNGNRLPTWSALMDELLTDLYPEENTRKEATKRAGGISGMLRLAEEYRVIRGRAQLDARLHQLMPDVGVTSPGKLHVQLLALPWADVYTTNYDTLLERTLDIDRQEFIPKIKQRYQVVVAAHGVPFSKSNGRPRVIKLHGSLRSGSPLILTEDDYRSYPDEFAPFVNTVHQSMLENVFCLIGFSGDDPNFLQWTGWVRDRLGRQAPPIYFITMDPIPQGQRLILENRSIFPISISDLGAKNGQKDYANSFNVLFKFLKEETLPQRSLWPERFPPAIQGHDRTVGELVEWVRFSKKNREEYPGWFVAPQKNRETALHRASHFQAIMTYRKKASKLSPKFRLIFLYEVAWLLETTLDGLNQSLLADIEQALIADSTVSKEVNALPFPDDALDLYQSEIERYRLRGYLTITGLRFSRELSDIGKFEEWERRLFDIPEHERDTEIERLALYERVLLHLERLERKEAWETLGRLKGVSGSGDIYWPVRVGALYAELGSLEHGKEIVRTGLHKIRDAIQADGETLALVSREHWAERILAAMMANDGFWPSTTKVNVDSSEQDDALPEPPFELTLGGWNPLRKDKRGETNSHNRSKEVYRDESARDHVEHPNSQLDLLDREIDRAFHAVNSVEADFDLRSVLKEGKNPEIWPEAIDAARNYTRLIDRVAYVPVVGRVSLSAHHLTRCFGILAPFESKDDIFRYLLRANSGGVYTTLESLTQAQIANLDASRSMQLYIGAIDFISKYLDLPASNWGESSKASIKFNLELASRLLCRLDNDQAEIAIDAAVRWYESPMLQEEYDLHGAFGSFFQRAINALPARLLIHKSAAIITLKRVSSIDWRAREWPTAVRVLPYEIEGLKQHKIWTNAVETSLTEAENEASGDAEARSFHCNKLDWLCRNGVMSMTQKRRFADFIWNNTSLDKLPNITGFYRGAVLAWPSKRRKRTTAAFRKWLLHEPFESLVRMTDIGGETKEGFGNVAEMLLGNVMLTGSRFVNFEWSPSDALTITLKLKAWWIDEGRGLVDKYIGKPHDQFACQVISYRLILISLVMQRIFFRCLSLQDIYKEKISDWMREMWDVGIRMNRPLIPLLFAGLTRWPEQEEIVVGLASDCMSYISDAYFLNAAITAAGFWLLGLDQPSKGSKRYLASLVDMVKGQSRAHMQLALASIADLLKLGAAIHFKEWAEELNTTLTTILFNFSQIRSSDDIKDFQSRPALRRAVALALVALGKEFDIVRSKKSWKNAIKLITEDPLLEIRNVAQLL